MALPPWHTPGSVESGPLSSHGLSVIGFFSAQASLFQKLSHQISPTQSPGGPCLGPMLSLVLITSDGLRPRAAAGPRCFWGFPCAPPPGLLKDTVNKPELTPRPWRVLDSPEGLSGLEGAAGVLERGLGHRCPGSGQDSAPSLLRDSQQRHSPPRGHSSPRVAWVTQGLRQLALCTC